MEYWKILTLENLTEYVDGKLCVERWKKIIGFSDYMVSNFGRVKSMPRKVKANTGYKCIQEKILKQKVTKFGYLEIGLYNWVDGQRKTFKVHRLVGEHFIKNKNNKPQINHKDGRKTNNASFNLEWMTCSENQFHSLELGLRKPPSGDEHYCYGKVGSLHPGSKAIVQYSLSGTVLGIYDSLASASRKTALPKSNISRAAHNGRNHCGGFIWKYK